MIVRYRSRQETARDIYPRLESVRDNFGNIWTPAEQFRTLPTETILQPGDVLEVRATAAAPEGRACEFLYEALGRRGSWSRDSGFRIEIGEGDIRENFEVDVSLKGALPYHALGDFDDWVKVRYAVRPRRTAPTAR